MAVSNANGHLDAHLSAPKYGTLIPNRIFVGGIRWAVYIFCLFFYFSIFNWALWWHNYCFIFAVVTRLKQNSAASSQRTVTWSRLKSLLIELELAKAMALWHLKQNRRHSGYKTRWIYHIRLRHFDQILNHFYFDIIFQGECVVLRDRKLNIAPAIKKQTVVATNGAVYYATQPAPLNNMPIDQFTAAAAASVYPPGVPAIYPQTMPYQPFYQYYSVPMVSVCRITPPV